MLPINYMLNFKQNRYYSFIPNKSHIDHNEAVTTTKRKKDIHIDTPLVLVLTSPPKFLAQSGLVAAAGF